MAARPDSSAVASSVCTAASALACCPNTSGASLSGMAAMWACSVQLNVKGAAFLPNEMPLLALVMIRRVASKVDLPQEHA